ncbi:hypothetical protein, partial [Umezawaea sp. NPDC059074]|uniref:hypothetical protein n=1 Tax=Umezawaea sp. NPDC059074 TaxID=3346716 RepID=UPI0036976B68
LGTLLDLDAHLVMVDVGGLPQPDVLDAIRLFGAEVIPRLHRTPPPTGRTKDSVAQGLPGAD